MTSLSIAAKWRERSQLDEGTSAQQVRAVTFAVVLSYGCVLAARASSVGPALGTLLWLAMPWWAAPSKVARFTCALAFGYAAMMLGVCAWQTSLPPPMGASGPVPFGEHPVTVRAGFPWPGVEGCTVWSLAKDRVPFDMGVDAMLVNLTVCTAVIWWLMRRARHEVLAGLVAAAGGVAAICGLAGTLQLVVMFD